MRSHLHQLFLALLMTLGVICAQEGSALALPLTEVMAQTKPEAAPSLEALSAKYRAELDARKKAQSQIAALERQYDALTAKIDRLKRQGISNLNRGELQDLYRQGRRLAEQLGQVQQGIQQRDERMERLAAGIMAQYDVKMRQLERDLVSAKGSERGKLIGQLNQLSRQRAEYAQPLPQLDNKRVEAMLRTSEGLDNPDDMLAMADELQDAEQEVLKKLGWVNERLDELKSRKRLLQRASAFSREESFFEESARSRALARIERPTSSSLTGSVKDAQETTTPPVSSNDGRGVDLSNGFETDDAAAAPDAGEAAAPSLPTTPADPSPGVDDPFAQPKDTIVISREADPAAGDMRAAGRDDRDLDRKIGTLERDQRLLKKQADALKKRAKALRQEANL